MASYASCVYDCNHMSSNAFRFALGLPQRSHRLDANECLFVAGRRATRLFYVRSGAIRLVRTTEKGADAVMHVARAGEWVAEASLFSDTYHCDAFADEPTILVSISRASLIERFERDGKSALEFARMLAANLRALRQMHEIVRVRRADDRVLTWLRLRGAGQPGALELDRTWTQVANELALTREALYRALARLRRAGRVQIDGRRVVLRG